MSTKIIMYLEDEKVINESVGSFLKGLFPNLICCMNGEEGLEYIRNGHIPDLIVTDINMPHMDGKVFLKHVVQLGYDIPAIITSGHMIEDEIKKDECLRLCVKNFCQKPIDVRELIKVIQENLS